MAAVTLSYGASSSIDGRLAPGQAQAGAAVAVMRPIVISAGVAALASSAGTNAHEGRVDGLTVSAALSTGDYVLYAQPGAILRNVSTGKTKGDLVYLKSDGTLEDAKQTGGYFTIVGMWVSATDFLFAPVFNGYK